MIYNDFASSGSDSPVVSATTPIVDSAKELRTKSHNDYSTSERTLNEPALHASPLTASRIFGEAMGVPVSGQYGTMMGLAHHSPLLYPTKAGILRDMMSDDESITL